ncbi:hypothetical protein Vretifemale_9903, partial [Volvox reticuliferus]
VPCFEIPCIPCRRDRRDRTCNEKLERTRQARSDKRRQQTGQAERKDLRANAGRQSPVDDVSCLKRQHDEGPGYSEKYTQEGSGYVLRKRNWWPSLPATSVALAAAPKSSPVPVPMLSSAPNQPDAQDVLALHWATRAAVGTGGGAMGGVHVQLSGHGHGHANHGTGKHEGGSGCGGASSRSSLDDGYPHLQLLRMDSVSSRPGGMDSQGHSMATRNGGAGSSAVAALGSRDPGDHSHVYMMSGEALCKQRATAPGARAGVATGSQAAVLLQELYGIESGDVRFAVGRGVHSGSDGGLVAARGIGHVPWDVRSDVEARLPDSGGRLALHKSEASYIDTPPLRGRIENDVLLYGNGSGAGADAGALLFPAAAASTEQRLVAQLQAPVAEGSRAEGRVVALHSEHRAPHGAGTDFTAMETRCQKDDLYSRGRIAPAPVIASADGEDDVDEAIPAALRVVIASLMARRGTARPQPDAIAAAVARLANYRERGEAMAAAELVLSALVAGRDSAGPTLRGNSYDTTVVGCRGGVRAPSHVAAAGPAIPVLDLAADAHVPAPALVVPQVASAGRKLNIDNCPPGSGADPSALQIQRLHQQLILQLTQETESEYNTPRLAAHLSDRRQPLQQQHVKFSQASPDRRQQVQLVLGMAANRGSVAAAASEVTTAAAAPPTPPQVHRPQLDGAAVQREFQRPAANANGRYHRSTYDTYVDLAAQQMSSMDGKVGAVGDGRDVREFLHLRHLLDQLGVQVVLQ